MSSEPLCCSIVSLGKKLFESLKQNRLSYAVLYCVCFPLIYIYIHAYKYENAIMYFNMFKLTLYNYNCVHVCKETGQSSVQLSWIKQLGLTFPP